MNGQALPGDPQGPAEAPVEKSAEEPEQEPAWKRRRRLDAVFGDVLPDTTGDERDPQRSRGSNDDWLRDQVPPHHGS